MKGGKIFFEGGKIFFEGGKKFFEGGKNILKGENTMKGEKILNFFIATRLQRSSLTTMCVDYQTTESVLETGKPADTEMNKQSSEWHVLLHSSSNVCLRENLKTTSAHEDKQLCTFMAKWRKLVCTQPTTTNRES